MVPRRTRVLQVTRAPLVLRVILALQVRQVHLEAMVARDLLVPQEQRQILAQQATPVPPAQQQQVQRVPLDLAQLVLLDSEASQVRQDHKDARETQVPLVFLVRQGHRVSQAQ